MPDAPDPDYDPNSATIPLSGPRPTLSGRDVDLPLPQELAKLLPAGAYEVTDFLGAGGMGAVYKGMQIRLKRPVAIKIMRRDVGKDHDFEARFEREAQAMAKLNHPNIISVIDFGEAGPDYLFIVMELVDGTDLMDVIRSKQMTQEMALTLLPQICDALQFAHDHGIVHRDIKPSNIMLTRDGRVKMADFGLAKHFDHAESGFRTQTGTGMGTPDYAAPEQFDPTTPVDHRADIYALGVMIYQMITGALPRGVWRPPSQRAPVSTQWDAVVSRAMQNDPSERYQKASEVKTELSSIPLVGAGRASGPSAAANSPQTALGGPNALPKSRAPLIIGLLVGAVVITLGAFFALRDTGDGRAAGPPAAASSSASSNTQKEPATPNTALAGASALPKATTPAPALPESGWKPLVSQTEWQKYSKGTTDYQGQQVTNLREYKDGLLHMSRISLYGTQPFLNGAIRARLVMRVGSEGGGVSARNSGKQRYFFNLADQGTVMVLAVKTPESQAGKTLGSYRLPKPLQTDEKFTIELRIQGDQLTGLFNGQEVVRATDQRVKETGTWGIDSSDAWFESVEVQPLPAAATPALAVPALPESGWRPLFTEAEWKAKPGFKNGQINLSHARATKPQTWSDGAIRARIEYRDGSKSPSLVARQIQSGGRFYYRLGIGSDGRHIFLSHMDPEAEGNWDILGRGFLPAALKPGDKLLIELSVQGNRLTGLLDGKVIIEAQDTRLQAPGEWGIIADEGWFESVEVQTLEAAPPSVLPSPNLPVSSSPSPPSPSIQWRKAGWTAEDLKNKTIIADGGWARIGEKAGASNGWLIATGGQNVTFKDGVVRLRYRWQGEAIILKTRNEKTFGQVQLWGPHVSLGIYLNSAETRLFQQVTLPEPLKVGDEGMFEVAAIGNRLYARLNDSIVLSSPEIPELAPSGFCAIQSVNTSFRDVEYAILDGLPEAEALRLLGVDEQGNDLRGKMAASPGTEIWQDALKDRTFSQSEGKCTIGPDGFHSHIDYIWRLLDGSSRDGAIRMVADYEGPQTPKLVARSDAGSKNQYQVNLEPGGSILSLVRKADTAYFNLAKAPLASPLRTGEQFELELRAIGSELTVSLNGNILLRSSDTTLPEGRFGIWATAKAQSPVRSLQFLPLAPSTASFSPSPSLPVSSSSVATATKEAPFTNTLGMKFVPVPGTPVLFSIWHTRVQDYAAFAKAQEEAGKKVDGAWKNQQKNGVLVGREPDHPVCAVNWDDAQAFCAWLTEKDTAAGKLPQGAKYRLPTDAEWSNAAGLPPEQGATPQEKNIKNDVDFPWGKAWPPTQNVGNYADETFHAQFPPDENAKEDWNRNYWIAYYSDGYAVTSPVGSFPANAYGLYDMGGNVWQWCEDWWSPGGKTGVLRGASWNCSKRASMLSSCRSRLAPETRDGNNGFRCVLEPGPSTSTTSSSPSPSVPQSSVATATKEAPFINTLGMKFVPVPITGGPTDKQRVLFSIWETRVHDYEVFVKGAKREWKKSGIEQGTTHPAVNMNCEDAMAFCAWLTETERKAGKLDAQFAYRLPSDHEWSCAVGIGDKEDAAKTPEEKNIQVPVFPWGNQWPPPADAGNYAGLELKPLIDSGKLMGGRTDLGEWQDSFVQTAPCGSFRESRDGLFDLGGNAFEWCDTPWSATSAGAIIRGGSSHDGQRERLFSSLRVEKSLNTTSANLGFRCVLAPTKPSPP